MTAMYCLPSMHKGHRWADAGSHRQRHVEKLFALVRGERFQAAVAHRLNHEVRSQGQRAATGLSAAECEPSFLLSGRIPGAENAATHFCCHQDSCERVREEAVMPSVTPPRAPARLSPKFCLPGVGA